jgi:hypothetical protein
LRISLFQMHGGVDWNGEAARQLRFDQLIRAIDI